MFWAQPLYDGDLLWHAFRSSHIVSSSSLKQWSMPELDTSLHDNGLKGGGAMAAMGCCWMMVAQMQECQALATNAKIPLR